MWLTTIVFGLALIALGPIGYVVPEVKSPTAFIPSAFGAVLVICGVLARKDQFRKHAMHAAAAIALIGFVIPAVMAGPKLPQLISEGKVLRANGSDASFAIIMQTIMAAICLIFVLLCVNSFFKARLARRKVGLPDPNALP